MRGTKEQLIAQIALLSLEPGKVYECEITDPDRRSLNANSYYWTLATKYAKWGKSSVARVHNEIMETYGEAELIDGRPVFIILRDDVNYKEFTKLHVRPTSQWRRGTDGQMYRTFVKIQDSHTYNPAQFSRLIDALINEIKGSDAPIETMTPRELEALKGYESTRK